MGRGFGFTLAVTGALARLTGAIYAGRVLRELTGGAVPDGYQLPVDRSMYAKGFMRPVQQVTVPVRDFQR